MKIVGEDALRLLEEWSRSGAPVHLEMRQARQRSAGAAVVNKVLPHTQKVLAMLRDEAGAEVAVTVSLAGAEWQAGTNGSDRLTASFSNGNEYVFGRSSDRARG